MSVRYECGAATETPLGVLSGRSAANAGVLTAAEVRRGEYAVIIGDPWASAYALTGTPAELAVFSGALAALVAGLNPGSDLMAVWYYAYTRDPAVSTG